LRLLNPHLEILAEGQQRLWPSLAGLARARFVLYGRTASALRYGDRVSVDMDERQGERPERLRWTQQPGPAGMDGGLT
jgi:hypothetical protein